MKLLIMAAGIGSRYGGLKQIDGFGPNGETIMEYSIYDAIKSGFEEVVFIIQDNMIRDLYEKFDHNFGGKVKVSHVVQKTSIEVDGKKISRKKPWGTAHAILSARESIDTPFVVINADDYYGQQAFTQLHGFLSMPMEDQYALIGYKLGNTLSDSGHVARGICQSDKNDFLVSIVEKTRISRELDGIYNSENGVKEFLSEDTVVSMNCWALQPSVFTHIQKSFDNFIRSNGHSENAEFYIPNVLQKLINDRSVGIKVIENIDHWFGVTYASDKKGVTSKIEQLVNDGAYPMSLWA